jgi:hypothetical protein
MSEKDLTFKAWRKFETEYRATLPEHERDRYEIEWGSAYRGWAAGFAEGQRRAIQAKAVSIVEGYSGDLTIWLRLGTKSVRATISKLTVKGDAA